MSKLFICISLFSVLISQTSAAENPVVDIFTNRGLIAVQLEAEKAPITVTNFLTYVNEEFYKGTIFHRVIKNFMIQGGGFTTDYQQKPTHSPIILETANGLKNNRGTIAMARTNAPNSATAQFFINTVNNPFPAPGYAVFGNVLSGMDIVDAISNEPTQNDVPVKQVIIEAAHVRKAQLSFRNLKTSYAVGETLEIALQEDTIQRKETLDLWVAALTPAGTLLFISPENKESFSTEPAPFKRSVEISETAHSIAKLTVPSGISGKYTLFAIFNASGSNVSNLNDSLRSNLASAVVELK